MSAQTKPGDSSFRPIQFWNDSREELKKVARPTRAETTRATGVTLVIIFFVALILALLDLVFNRVMQVVL